MPVDRRTFITISAAASALLLWSGCGTQAQEAKSSPYFPYGVASGDPTQKSVMYSRLKCTMKYLSEWI